MNEPLFDPSLLTKVDPLSAQVAQERIAVTAAILALWSTRDPPRAIEWFRNTAFLGLANELEGAPAGVEQEVHQRLEQLLAFIEGALRRERREDAP